MGSPGCRGHPPRGRSPRRTAEEGPLPALHKGEAKLPCLVGICRDCSQLPSEKVTYLLVYLFHAPQGNEYFAQVRTIRLSPGGMHSARSAAPRQFGDVPPARIEGTENTQHYAMAKRKITHLRSKSAQ